jgi:hypothetical protein
MPHPDPQNGRVSIYDDEPELAGYEPIHGRPIRSGRMLAAMRIVVIVGLVALVFPGIVTTVMVASNSAQEACRLWVKYEVPSSPGWVAHFEVLGGHGVGWACYTKGAFGGDQFVASLGLIPGPPTLPDGRIEHS